MDFRKIRKRRLNINYISKCKIIFSDLDGTLLNEKGEISSYTKEIISKLSNHDIKFVIATGRCFETAKKIKDDLGISCYLIVSNGAEIYDENENLIYTNYIPETIVNDLVKINVDSSFRKFIVQNRIFYTEKFNNILDTSVNYEQIDFEKRVWNQTINFYYQNENKHLLCELENKLNGIFQEKLSICISTNDRLDIMNSNINKGEALKIVLKNLGYHLNEAIAFGDQLNDLEMLKLVKYGFYLENSCIELKKKLDIKNMIGKNENEAVAKKINEIILFKN
ncbi:MAG: Cof-type HAD-IIB family hydrolase [Cetobacterium sp.]